MSSESSNTVDTVVSNLEMKARRKSLDGMLADARAMRAMFARWSDQWPPTLHKRRAGLVRKATGRMSSDEIDGLQPLLRGR
jgi:hypothetical protein